MRAFTASARSAPFTPAFVLVSAAVLTTVSFYYGGRAFFRQEFYGQYFTHPYYELIEFLYWFAATGFIYAVVPSVLILLVLREKLRDFGWSIGDWRLGLKVSVIFILVMLVVTWFISADPAFQARYPHCRMAARDWTTFAIFEAFFLVYFIGWEYIWRGYVLFGLEKVVGAPLAVLVQTLPFVILHNGKPALETFSAILAGVALGALAVRTRSFWYGVLIHWTVMLSIDLFSTLRLRSGVNGLGFDAFVKLLGGG